MNEERTRFNRSGEEQDQASTASRQPSIRQQDAKDLYEQNKADAWKEFSDEAWKEHETEYWREFGQERAEKLAIALGWSADDWKDAEEEAYRQFRVNEYPVWERTHRPSWSEEYDQRHSSSDES